MIRASKHHLAQIGESYFEHLGAALGFSFALAKASFACGLHAVIPGLCTAPQAGRLPNCRQSS